LNTKVGCEFVLSTDLTSRLSAQLSSCAELNDVFDDLFTPDGIELYLKGLLLTICCDLHELLGLMTCFRCLVLLAEQGKGDDVGYHAAHRQQGQRGGHWVSPPLFFTSFVYLFFIFSFLRYYRPTSGAILNPPQDSKISYLPGDKIIVLADDDTEYT